MNIPDQVGVEHWFRVLRQLADRGTAINRIVPEEGLGTFSPFSGGFLILCPEDDFFFRVVGFCELFPANLRVQMELHGGRLVRVFLCVGLQPWNFVEKF